MPSAAPEVAHNGLEAHERLLIDQAIAKHGNRPGALLGILEAVQSANAHKFLSMDALRYIADETGVPPARVYSAATFYCALQSRAPGRQCDLRLPRNRLPHARLPRSAGKALPRSRPERPRSRREQRSRQAGAHHGRSPLHRSHRGLLRPVRAGAGGRSRPPHSQPRE